MKFPPRTTAALMNRRRFLLTTAAAAAGAASLHSLGLAQTAVATAATATAATLTLHPDKSGPTVPANFVGLSYETQQLSDPTFFTATNTGLIAQLRALAPHGVLRLGGNTSDVGWWKPTPASKQPPLPSNVVVVPPQSDSRPFQELSYSVTPLAVTNLRAFLDATGWTCLYGINLGSSTPARAAEEAAFVAKTLGTKLEYFQLGNEPDLFASRFRDKATWTPDAYFDLWYAAADAIRKAVPSARFGLPDTAGNPAWYATIVDRLLKLPDPPCAWCGRTSQACDCAAQAYTPGSRPAIGALTHHYYFGGPPSNPEVNIPALLQHSDRVDLLAKNISAATARLNAAITPPAPNVLTSPIPYRMTEGNTCFRGGKPGVSDVFAAALWSADYFLTLASLGYAGVNLHGGDGQMVANSLGGTLPGDLIVAAEHGDPATHPHPYYTPVAHMGEGYVLEPVAQGMLFAGHFAGATMIPVDFHPGGVNATAYAAKLPSGQVLIAIVNKDRDKALTVDLPGFALELLLHGPALNSAKVELSDPTSLREVSVVAPSTAVLLHNTR